jgi:hypothetical protein
LTELDERRAELVQHLAQAATPLRRRLVRRRAPPLEEVAEAVPGRDAADLGQPAEAARLRRGFHRRSVHDRRDETCARAFGPVWKGDFLWGTPAHHPVSA